MSTTTRPPYRPVLGSSRHQQLEIASKRAYLRWRMWNDRVHSLRDSEIGTAKWRRTFDSYEAAWSASVDAGNKLQAYLDGQIR